MPISPPWPIACAGRAIARAPVAVARRGLAAGPPAGVGLLLHFQLQLAQAGDEGSHDIGEALAGRLDAQRPSS